MAGIEGVNVSGEVAGFDYQISDKVQDYSIDDANHSLVFDRNFFLADDDYRRAGSKMLVATVEEPFKADSKESLDAALEASRQLPPEQTLRNTILRAESLVNGQENQFIDGIKSKLKRQAAGLITEVIFGTAGSTTAVIGTVEGIREHSKSWAGVALISSTVALGGFANLKNRIKTLSGDTIDTSRGDLRHIHRRQDMIEFAKHATEPVREGFKFDQSTS